MKRKRDTEEQIIAILKEHDDAHSKGPSMTRLREEAEGMMVKVSGTRGTLRE
jgi:hypothetical protein